MICTMQDHRRPEFEANFNFPQERHFDEIIDHSDVVVVVVVIVKNRRGGEISSSPFQLRPSFSSPHPFHQMSWCHPNNNNIIDLSSPRHLTFHKQTNEALHEVIMPSHDVPP
jgi:hypothetical protein